MERAAVVEPPPELVTRILFEVTQGASRTVVKPPLARRLFGNTLGAWLEPVLQPRFAMGMATTLLSLAMLIRGRQLSIVDLNPVKLWNSTELQVSRAWERGVKNYENLRLVFEIQSRLKQWSEETAAVNNTQNGPGSSPAGSGTGSGNGSGNSSGNGSGARSEDGSGDRDRK
jgi:uncharacterized membrane protein YgcG